MNETICKVIAWNNGKIEYSSVTISGNNVIENDKKYGFLIPTNGVLTFSVTNRDGEINEKGVDRAVKYALQEWGLYVPITFKKVPSNGNIRIEFKSESEDELLTPNTLAYMYYPLGGINNGKCVVNTRFYWTNHGKGIDMYKIDPIHYQPNSGVMGATHDLDKVLRHEFGHGVFGLPHDVNSNNIMSGNYGVMREHLSDMDISRARAKAGTKQLHPNILKRWINWITHASERSY